LVESTALAGPGRVRTPLVVDDGLEVREGVRCGRVGDDTGGIEPVVEGDRLELGRSSMKRSRRDRGTYERDGRVEEGEDFLFCAAKS
jgi:hypothetical protein